MILTIRTAGAGISGHTGNPAQEAVIEAAGVARALAVMVAIEDQATSVMTILNCRAISKRLLITAASQTDDMLSKLQRAGADRVLSPFQVAAQFVLLATTRPAVRDFLQTLWSSTMQHASKPPNSTCRPICRIGSTLASLALKTHFNADVIGILGC